MNATRPVKPNPSIWLDWAIAHGNIHYLTVRISFKSGSRSEILLAPTKVDLPHKSTDLWDEIATEHAFFPLRIRGQYEIGSDFRAQFYSRDLSPIPPLLMEKPGSALKKVNLFDI
jgi:hypothetical protein